MRSRPVRWIQANAALIAGASVVVGVLVLAVLIFFVLPPLIVSSSDVTNKAQRLKLQNDVRATGVQLLAGAILAAGAFFTARTIRVNREGQITERFTRAIDQLGNQKLDVRLGGIYALERIARDSRRDHGPIMEVLATYVREHARWHQAKERTRLSGKDPDEHPGAELELPLWSGPVPAADVQAVLTVLGRRKTSYELDPLMIDLSNVDLRGATFSGQFRYVILIDAHLEGATFQTVDLRGAVIMDSHLEFASINNANFQGSHLINVDLRRARIELTDLRDVTGIHSFVNFKNAVVDSGLRVPHDFDVREAGALILSEDIL
jgi:hypothetical protein